MVEVWVGYNFLESDFIVKLDWNKNFGPSSFKI